MEKSSSLRFWRGHRIAYKLLWFTKCPKHSPCVVHSTHVILYPSYVLKSKGPVLHLKTRIKDITGTCSYKNTYSINYCLHIPQTYRKDFLTHILKVLARQTKILKLLIPSRVWTLLNPSQAKPCLHTYQIRYFARTIPIFFCLFCMSLLKTYRFPTRTSKVKQSKRKTGLFRVQMLSGKFFLAPKHSFVLPLQTQHHQPSKS